MTELSPDLRKKFAQVRLLAMDVDGVLTDGGVYTLEDGREFRRFNIKDGLGIKMVMQQGVRVAIISSNSCQAITYRAHQLGVTEVFIGVEEKLPVLQEICRRVGIGLEDVCYIGDDLPDLRILEQAGLACAPANAVTEVLKKVDYITHEPGGFGSVREVCELICS